MNDEQEAWLEWNGMEAERLLRQDWPRIPQSPRDRFFALLNMPGAE